MTSGLFLITRAVCVAYVYAIMAVGTIHHMIESATMPMSSNELELLEAGNSKERENLIESLFGSLEEETSARLLSGFCNGEREVYNNHPFVSDVSFDDRLSGTLAVDFTGSAYLVARTWTGSMSTPNP